ncbi:unnamed protein product, partial [Staurois parvus]
MDRGHWVRHWIVWLDSGHWVTRHQVIWLDSGHRVIWQGSGLRVNRHDSEHRVIRYHGFVWLDSAASGHQASGHLARQRAPDQRASSVGLVNWPNRIVRLDQFIMLGRE